MRTVAIALCLAATVGCQGGKFARYSAICPPGTTGTTPCPPGEAGAGAPCPPGAATPQGGPGACQPGPQATQPPPPVKQPPPPVKAPPVREVRAPAEEVTETRQTASAIAPDILLIPRTVLVPYAPHVPTGPVRVSGVSPAARVIQTEERVTQQAPGPVSNPRLDDALDQCLQQLKLLNTRIVELESRAANLSAAPVPYPPAQPSAVPCPPLPSTVGPRFGHFRSAIVPCPPGVAVPVCPPAEPPFPPALPAPPLPGSLAPPVPMIWPNTAK